MVNRDKDRPLDPETLPEVLAIIGELATKALAAGYIFRGEPKCYRLVSSSLYREFPNIEEQHFHVESVQDEILEAAKEFVGDWDKDELLAQLQHYGHPTNVIDFTNDYHIALFFACDGHAKEDGRVVLLRQSEYPVTKPRSPTNRVVAQKSIFVRPPDGVVKPSDVVVIPSKLKDSILDYLSTCHGIRTATIYNDLHGFMRYHDVHRSAYAEFYGGITCQLRGEHEKAIERYDKAIELNPRLMMGYNNRGVVYMAMGNHRAAVEDFSRVIESDPTNAGAFSNRGLAYRRQGDQGSAVRDFDHAISLNPRLADAYVNRGNLRRARGDYDRAIEDYDKAIEIEPQSACNLSNRGGAYSSKGAHVRALQDHDRAVALAPEVAPIHGNRGDAYWRSGDHDNAVRDYTKAIELDPKSAYFTDRGSAYWHKRDYDRAMRDFDEAIELDPRSAIAYHNRGVACCALGRWEGALEDLRTARNLGFDTAREFLNEFGNVSSFEQKYDVRVDPRSLSDFRRSLCFQQQCLNIQLFVFNDLHDLDQVSPTNS